MAKGIVSKISGNKCIIITQDGRFERVPLPRGTIRVGQEIVIPSYNWTNLLRYSLIAASVLLAVFGFYFNEQTASATPVAYVSLDINPSMELAVNEKHQVISISSFNNDAQRLLTNLDYQSKDIYQVVSLIVQQAVNLKYVAADRPNLVVSTVVNLKPDNNLDTRSIQDAVAKPLAAKALKSGIIVMKAESTDRTAANKINLTTGKYLFYKNKQQSGNAVSLEELKKQSIASLVKAKKIKLPQFEEIIEQDQPHPGKKAPQGSKNQSVKKVNTNSNKQQKAADDPELVDTAQTLPEKVKHVKEQSKADSKKDAESDRKTASPDQQSENQTTSDPDKTNSSDKKNGNKKSK